jgi:hypothetical protein
VRWALLSQQPAQDRGILPWLIGWISFLLYQGVERCQVGLLVGFLNHTAFWCADAADPAVQ